MEKILLHSDLNNFYASVECLYNPGIRNSPVAVCGDPEKRHGIVLAKNQIAKKFGIKTGETIWQAQQKCPHIVFVQAHFNRYREISKSVKEIYFEYTPYIESFGLDESWLDISDYNISMLEGMDIAHKIRNQIKSQLGVTVSIGVSFNKIFAKLGSDYKKPDAVTLITKENFKDIVWPLPVSNLLYVGNATETKLKKYNIHTIGDLAKASPTVLKSEIGINGIMLSRFANGLDDSAVDSSKAYKSPKSVGNGTTLPYDICDISDIGIVLTKLCESICYRMRVKNLSGATVSLSIKDENLNCSEYQCHLSVPSNSPTEIYNVAFMLFEKNFNRTKKVRSLTVRVSNLISSDETQISMLHDFEKKFVPINTAVVDNFHSHVHNIS